MPWTAGSACAALRSAGVHLSPADAHLEPRDGRQLLRLADDRLAWFADDEGARERMARERRVLRLIASRCTFAVPRVLFESADGAFDVRAGVRGLVDAWHVFAKVQADPTLSARMGGAIGALLAEQHTRIGADDVTPWLPSHVLWPEPTDSIRERLPRVVTDAALLARIDALLDRYEAVPVDDADRVLVHGDVGFHNLAFDPDTYAVRGVFDYEGAAWADRHHDFRYLLFDAGRDEMLEAALGVYEPAVGRALSRDRVLLYNAASAVSFLAFRDGVPPDERSCGRTLAEDLAWVRGALERQSAER